jgi:hypothetical protein
LRSASIVEEEQAALTAARKATGRLEERADAAFPDPPPAGPATEPAEAHSTPATTSETPEEDREKLHA